MAHEPKDPRKAAQQDQLSEQKKRDLQIHLANRQKEDVLRRLVRKAPGTEWHETYALVKVPGPKTSTLTYRVTLPSGWQANPNELTIGSMIKFESVQ